MEDFGEGTSPETRSADGTPPARIHNRYPRDYHCAVQRIVRGLDRPLVRFQRSGWTGAARCSVNVWGGDPTTVWGFDGLRSAVTQALTIGMSGVSRWGSDIGGYNSFGADERLSRELLDRWIQLGAVSGVMRTKRSGIALPAYERPQIFDPASLPIWRRYAKLHTQLLPYIQAAEAEYRATGHAADAPRAAHRSGRPARRRGRRPVRLRPRPAGGAGARARSAHPPALSAARALGRPLALGELPAGRRQPRAPPCPGAARRPPADAARAARGAPAARAGRRRAAAAARRRGHAGAVPRRRRGAPGRPPRPHAAARVSARALRLADGSAPRAAPVASKGAGRWSLQIRGKRARRYSLQATLGSLRRPFAPRSVLLGGRPLARSAWSYDPSSGTLRVAFRCRSSTLTVAAASRGARPGRPRTRGARPGRSP